MRTLVMTSLVVSALLAAGCKMKPAHEAGPGAAQPVASAPDPGPQAAPAATPQITKRTIEYRDGDTKLVGHLALPVRDGRRHPAVLVVHEWWGRNSYPDQRADELAQLGYVAFAVDMYGDGRATADPKQAGEWAEAVRKDPAAGIRRLRAALDLVRGLPETDPARVACIGFCFGGTVSLEAAWAGLDLVAVVSFHGNLTTPRPEQTKGVKASILVCHGADDPFVSPDVVAAFEKSMRENAYDWEFAEFGGAVHAFTNPAADGSFNPGVKYQALAAARSWTLMRSFLEERFR